MKEYFVRINIQVTISIRYFHFRITIISINSNELTKQITVRATIARLS